MNNSKPALPTSARSSMPKLNSRVIPSKATSLRTEITYFMLGLLGIVILWHLDSVMLSKSFLPTPLEAGQGLLTLKNNYDLGHHFLLSTYRLLSSLGLALAIGVPLGYLCGRYEQLNRWLSPYISFFYPLPKIVFLPILIVMFGLGDVSKIILLTVIICFQVLVIVRDAAAKMPTRWLTTMRTMTASSRLWILHLYLPYLLPAIVTSLRVSLGTAIAVLFFSETSVSVDGLGYIILDTMETRNYPEMYGAILLLSLLGFVLYGLLAYWERRVTYDE